MKNVGPIIAITSIALVLAPTIAAAAATCASAPPGEFARPASLSYPSFCSIPPTPKNVRPVAAFKAAVVRTRVAGAVVLRQSGPETFSLSGTEAFAEGAKHEAAPPPVMTEPQAPGTEAFAAASRAKAAPPKRHHRRR